MAGVISFFAGFLIPQTWPLMRFVAFVAAGSCFSYFLLSLRKQKPAEIREPLQEQRVSFEVFERFDRSEPFTIAPRAGEFTAAEEEEREPAVEPEESEEPGQPEEQRAHAEPEEETPAVPPQQSTIYVPHPIEERVESPMHQFREADFFDGEEDVFANGLTPKQEFNTLIKRVLAVVKNVNFAHTAAFFWCNREKSELVIEAFVSDSPKFTSIRKREMGSDLITQVSTTRQPVLVTDVNPSAQAELLGYYDAPMDVRSFLAVPVFFPRKAEQPDAPVGVLAIDCLSSDAYGPETVVGLGQFTKLISGLIRSYTDKYDLLTDSAILQSMSRMRESWRASFDVRTIVRSLAEEVSRQAAWDHLTVLLYDEKRKAWIIQTVMNRTGEEYIPVGQEIDIERSLTGRALQTGETRIFSRLQLDRSPRFLGAERIRGGVSFAVLPIVSLGRCYGAVTLENASSSYGAAELTPVTRLCEAASAGLEVLSLNEIVNNYVLIDETTGVSSRKFFLDQLANEAQRALDYSTELTLLLVSVDAMNDHLARHGREGFDFVMRNVGRMIKTSIRPYDVIGRYEMHQFAVLLVNTTANEANIWAEKLRKNIASNVINIDEKSFSVTVSVGICGATQETTDMDMLDRASHVLQKAIEHGGNIVRVF